MMVKNAAQRISEERRSAIAELARIVNLPEIAQENGMTVAASHTRNPKALCPFHDDHTPSLTFHKNDDSGRSYYHCFACGARGDVFDLIKKLRGCDFPEALNWVASRYGWTIPSLSSHATRMGPSARDRGLQLAFDIYSKATTSERDTLQAWAGDRGFDVAFLKESDV